MQKVRSNGDYESQKFGRVKKSEGVEFYKGFAKNWFVLK